MADAQRLALGEVDVRVRVYSPIGELLLGIAYLVRRLLENRANTGFLRQATREKRPIEELSAPPVVVPPAIRPADALQPAAVFQNCRLSDFTNPAVRRRFAQALENPQAALPIDLAVAGARRGCRRLLHFCPSPPDSRR
jgi:RHH-type proline utilization regulon transcriptional repressor/proline dehydrogenase/delta 1-pyrroline-5-carboxylate dehydrogenase